MITDFISITNLQRNLKEVFMSEKPVHVVLSKHEVCGLVFSQEAAELLMRSGILDTMWQQLKDLPGDETRPLNLKKPAAKTRTFSVKRFIRGLQHKHDADC